MGFSFDHAKQVFGSACLRFEQAWAATGGTEACLGLAGRVLLIRIAGAGSQHLVKALEPLRVQAVPHVDATFCVYDKASTGVGLPSLHALGPDGALAGRFGYTPRGDLQGFCSPGLKGAFNYEARALSLWDSRQRLGFYATPDAQQLPGYELSSPLRTLFHWCFEEFGGQLVHAAALGNGQGGVLLAGKGGSGKSTTALACLCAGLGFAGDDYCLLEAQRPWVSGLYASAKLDWSNLGQMPLHPDALVSEPSQEGKAVVLLHQHYAAQLVPRIPIRAVLLPRVCNQTNSQIEPVDSRLALQALASSTISQLPGAASPALKVMQNLLEAVPCYELQLGSDRQGVIASVAAFLP